MLSTGSSERLNSITLTTYQAVSKPISIGLTLPDTWLMFQDWSAILKSDIQNNSVQNHLLLCVLILLVILVKFLKIQFATSTITVLFSI